MPWNIIGQDWAADLLTQHVASGEMRHAYLFCGPPGVGRRTLALRFAQAINCTQLPHPGQPCGVCRTCQQIERMQYADLSIAQVLEDATAIKVEQIRDLEHTLSLSPYSARYRIALLLNFEQATQNAQNALLKTLEEAPERAILLITAGSPENLLPTIVSRCEVMRLRPMSADALQEALEREDGVTPDQARLTAHLAGGRPGYALQLLRDKAADEFRTKWVAELERLLASRRLERFQTAEVISKDRDKLRQILLVWLSCWRDLLLCCACSSAPLTNLDLEDMLHALATHIDLATARERTSALEDALTGLDANLNPRLLTEVLLLDWPYVIIDKDKETTAETQRTKS
jgi:DNA polymerase-3 subunit delta'